MWGPDAYMYRKGRSTTWCYAFENDGPHASTVLGASFMINKEVIIDLTQNRAGFAQAKCPQYKDRPTHVPPRPRPRPEPEATNLVNPVKTIAPRPLPTPLPTVRPTSAVTPHREQTHSQTRLPTPVHPPKKRAAPPVQPTALPPQASTHVHKGPTQAQRTNGQTKAKMQGKTSLLAQTTTPKPAAKSGGLLGGFLDLPSVAAGAAAAGAIVMSIYTLCCCVRRCGGKSSHRQFEDLAESPSNANVAPDVVGDHFEIGNDEDEDDFGQVCEEARRPPRKQPKKRGGPLE